MTITLRPTDILVVVDVQNDFLPGGSLAVPDGDAVIEPVNALVARFPHVALTQDWHPPGHASFASAHPGAKPFEVIELPYGPQVLWPDHCVQGTPGAAFSGRLRADKAELVVRKGFNPGVDSYSGFQEADRRTRTGLAGYLRERGFRRVFCAGLATDYCVAWTALDARAEGFDTFVIEDASRGIDNGGSLARALADLDGAGVRRIRAGEVG